MTDFVVVIPARMESTRLPGKPLADICGRPMVLRVVDRARRSGAGAVLVATDDDRIASVCRADGVDVEMTARAHASGTDRIAEVARLRCWDEARIVVNVQGDEPLLPPELVDQVAGLLAAADDADMATLQTTFMDTEQFTSPNTAKVITDGSGSALYFSRAPIPAGGSGTVPDIARRHIGIYAYRVRSLLALAAAEPCELEKLERLEQLRALWLGYRIVVADSVVAPAHGVDTPADLDKIRQLAARHTR